MIDLTPETTVYRAGHALGNGPTVYHVDRQCRQLRKARGIATKQLADVNDRLDPCRACIYGESPPGGQPDFSHYESLQSAAKEEADK